jgi:hypothetical protein
VRTPDRTRKLLYLRTWDEWRLDNIAKALPSYWQTTFQVMHGMNEVELADYDVLYFPSAHDQLFMLTQTERVLAYLAAGGNLIINGTFARPWLPFLKPFQAVPPRPYTNLMIRPHTPGKYFGRMDYETYHRHDGILGQYARGWSDAPEGAQLLSMIGAEDDLHPVDWVWRYPGGGNVFVHNGDCIHWFKSAPSDKPNLMLDILEAIIEKDGATAPQPR